VHAPIGSCPLKLVDGKAKPCHDGIEEA